MIALAAAMVASTLAAADVATFGFGLVIASDSDCPTAAAVRDQLRVLSFPAPDAASVAVHADDQAVTAVFGAPAGLQRGPRTLDLAPDCDRRASAVGLLIAAWLGQLPRPPSMTMEAIDPPVVHPAPRPVAPPRRPRPPSEPSDSTLGLAGSVGAYGGQNGGLGAGVQLEVGSGSKGPGWGWTLVLSSPVIGGFTGGLAPSWLRPAAEVDLRWRGGVAGRLVDLYVGPALGVALSLGQASHAPDRFDAGLGLAVRGNLGRTAQIPWLELRGRLWLTGALESHGVFDLGSGATPPFAEATAALGWSWDM